MLNANRSHHFLLLFCWGMIGVLAGPLLPRMALQTDVDGAESVSDAAGLAWELRRYRIDIAVTFADVALFPPGFRHSILHEFEEQIAQYRGENWKVQIHENRGFLPVSQEGLARLDRNTILPESAAKFDKLHFLTVSQEGSVLVVSGREWDQGIQRFGTIESQRTADRRDLARVLFSVANSLFRPTALLDRFADGEVKLRLRGAAYPPRDRSLSRPKKGDFWLPFYRKLSADGSVKQISELPWTFLELESPPKPGMVTMDSRLITGLRSPLTNRRRLRVEALAIQVHPEHESTRLQLLSQARQPLVGFDVDLRSQLDAPPEQVETHMSDRNGEITLAAKRGQPLVWFSVRSGDQVLARLPYLPGFRPEESLQLFDDSIRLEVEGKLAILEGDLMEAVVQRAVLMARIRKLAYAADWKQVAELRTRLDELPAARDFLTQLTAIRVPGMNAANEKKDRTTASRIKQMCEQSADLIKRYLNVDTVNELDEELAEIRKDATADAALLNESP